MKKGKRIFLGLFLAASLSSCSYNDSYQLFDTTVIVQLDDASSKDSKYIGNYLTKMSEVMDAYTKPASGTTTLYTLNHTNDAIAIGDDLFGALQFAEQMQTATDGWFNPLVGKLTNAWKNGVIEKSKPTQADVDAVEAKIPSLLAEVNSSSLVLDETNKTAQRFGNATIDLGAFGKGYALREVRRYVIEKKITSYFVNAGTSSLLVGSYKDGPWKIKFNEAPGYFFHAEGTAVGTSSLSQQKATVNGTTYTHIVNPFTGSATLDYYMCTVVGDDPGLDDALSTTFILAGPTKAAEIANKLEIAGESPVKYAFFNQGENPGEGTWDAGSTLAVES